ncbi:hypothetical protein BJ322DRAFT_1147820 [Thelephora terrestris]|uniref:BTB domain-containing protein n=1 Tax=Thelephora terrestris TaxID=56493 RepID=A0A9P6H3G2_9AGAM|nr:hypothetical protein BJ322DRAFT_1147820 [Thelephora terrestris]
MAATLSLREALNESISSGRFEDTKVILYSRRDSFGDICRPRALYASSHVLKSVPYFNDLLSGTFAEAELKDFSEAIDDEEIAEDYGYYSDSDLEDDDRVANPTEPPEIVAPLDEDPSSSSPTTNKSPRVHDELSKRPRQGKIIKIQDIAFITWRSLFFYLYTDSIQFAPLKSQGANARAQYLREPTTPDKPPPCSPKTIYSIATRLEIKALRDIAFDDIRSKVTSENVTIELFSGFASR